MGETPSPSIPSELLPLGFRFHPTDEELINFYLKRKINGRIRPADAAVIPEIDVCGFEPWDLPAKSVIRSDDPEWFFFAPVDRKYPSGGRSNRATGAGYWKATGKDRLIRSRPRGGTGVLVGMKKTLVFHRGRAPKGTRTNWIMHEYRTVEPEFESGGEQGGFVLCRLFRKPEETIAGLSSYEMEGNGFSRTSTRPSPCSTLQRTLEGEFATTLIQESPSSTVQKADDLQEEFATPLNQETPGSDEQEELQPLPDNINKQSADSRLVGEARYVIPYPVKPEGSHCNSNMTSDAGDQEAEITGGEASIPAHGAPLFDDLAQFLGPEYKHLFSDKFHQIKSPMLPSADYALCYDVDRTLVHYQTSEQHSVTELLDALLSTPEEYSADVSNYQTESTRVVPGGQISMINHGSGSNSVMNTNSIMRDDVDPEAVMAQGGPNLDASAQPRLPFPSYNYSSQMNTWNRNNEIQPSQAFVRCDSREESTSKLVPVEASIHDSCGEDLVAPANSVGTEINVRPRSAVNLNTFNFPGQQGVAGRRIRLQSPRHVNHTCKRVSKVDMISLISTGTTEADNHAKNQIAEETEASEPVVSDHEQSSSDDDGSTSPEFVFNLSAKEHEEQTFRLRTRQTNDAGVKLESDSLQQEAPSVVSLPARRIGVAVLVIASLLCAGTMWFFNF